MFLPKTVPTNKLKLMNNNSSFPIPPFTYPAHTVHALLLYLSCSFFYSNCFRAFPPVFCFIHFLFSSNQLPNSPLGKKLIISQQNLFFQTFDISFLIIQLKQSMFEIAKVYTTRLQRYRNCKVIVFIHISPFYISIPRDIEIKN